MTTNTPAGWYTDPHDATGLRYWDGNVWTEHTHRPDGTAAAPATDATAATAVMPVASSPTSQTEQFEVPPTGDEVPAYSAAAAGSNGDASGYYGGATGTPTDVPKKGLGGGAIIAIVAGAVILILAIAAILLAVLSSGSDDAVESSASPSATSAGEATAAPAPEATEEQTPTDNEAASAAGDAVIPAGWTQVTSPSGLISYAYAPDMTDAGEFIDLDTLSDQLSGVFLDATAEVSGMWIDTSATETAGSSVMLMTTTGGVDSNDLGAELEAFATSASAGTDDVQIGDAESFVTAVGYDAARLSYSSSSVGVTTYATVSIVVDGDTSVIVFASTPADSASSAEMAQQVADSLVINP
ncbi:DUF2510 domain-containing protein [Demequina aurantiaca]|uniref:DUF2510 domain-containing protein n=1 Tax=Demequina aurantiaca TaxID=676200 RepID=UPI003D33B2F3